MGNNAATTQTRDVGPFDRITLGGNNAENEFVIRQGERESLSIEAPDEILARVETGTHDGHLRIRMAGSLADRIRDALATSLTRPHIRYTVTARSLTGLEVFGMTSVDMAGLKTGRLALKLGGMGTVAIRELEAERLDVEVAMPGMCRVEASGRVEEQHVTLCGMSSYEAPHLACKMAEVDIVGPGLSQATVRADYALDVAISGPGSVKYYGNPRVRKTVSGVGHVTHVGGG